MQAWQLANGAAWGRAALSASPREGWFRDLVEDEVLDVVAEDEDVPVEIGERPGNPAIKSAANPNAQASLHKGPFLIFPRMAHLFLVVTRNVKSVPCLAPLSPK